VDGPQSSLAAPLPFGKYLLDEEIARGGMARVFRARLRGVGGFEKRLVVKQVLPELCRDPRFVAMFVDEAKTLVEMSHPIIVPVYELGVVDGIYFLAMEFVEGATLQEMLRDGGGLAPALVAHIAVQVCDALSYAHERFAIVHRDVTPRNVMVDDDGHVRLLDFGIAAPAGAAAAALPGEIFGSHGYMSPEQARGADLGPASDLFSLGATLYEALTGEPAFLRGSIEDTRTALLEGPLPDLAARSDVPREVADAILRLIVRDPAGRPASAREAAAAFRGWLAASHPRGVAAELGARADQARRSRPRRAARHRRAEHSERSEPPPGAPHQVRTLATSRLLAQAIDEAAPRDQSAALDATQPLAGRERTGERPAAARRRLAIGLAGALGLALVTLLAIWLGHSAPSPATTRVGHAEPASSRRATTAREPAAPHRPSADELVHVAPSRSSPEASATPGSASDRRDHAALAAKVTINAVPWAEVRIDGRSIGTTPRRNLSLAAGAHTLELSCPPLGRSARVQLRAVSGGTHRVLADLSADPPQITVD